MLRLGTTTEYFWTYWVLAILDTLLQLCVVYELSSKVFRPLESWAYEARKYSLSVLILSLTGCGRVNVAGESSGPQLDAILGDQGKSVCGNTHE